MLRDFLDIQSIYDIEMIAIVKICELIECWQLNFVGIIEFVGS